jgi:hypothetical protein
VFAKYESFAPFCGLLRGEIWASVLLPNLFPLAVIPECGSEEKFLISTAGNWNAGRKYNTQQGHSENADSYQNFRKKLDGRDCSHAVSRRLFYNAVSIEKIMYRRCVVNV